MNPKAAPTDGDDPTAARALLNGTLVRDNDGCTPEARPHDTTFLLQLQRHRAVGVDVGVDVDVAVTNIGFGDQGIDDHLRTLACMRHWLLARPDEYVLIGTVADIKRARAIGRLALGFDIEVAGGQAARRGLGRCRTSLNKSCSTEGGPTPDYQHRRLVGAARSQGWARPNRRMSAPGSGSRPRSCRNASAAGTV